MLRRACLGLAASAYLLAAASAQTNPTGAISGQVTDPSGLPLGGVTVTASSPALQGMRTAITSANGDYVIPFLPPGEYKVTFARAAFQTLEKTMSLKVAETATLDAQLSLAGIAESIAVVAEARNDFGQAAPAATSYQAEAIDKLPVGRDLRGAVLLAPGTTSTGPGGSLTISGAMSFESLYLVDGVVVGSTLLGQPRALFIEDAIEETTTWTANISAEYGHFGGGVVNAITKSGGNDFSGSFRTTFNNERWRALTPFEKTSVAGDPRSDEVVPTFEATLGGPIFRDRLWFFAAGRSQERPQARTLAFTNIPYENPTRERRYEGKLSFSVSAAHAFRGAYTRIDFEEENRSSLTVMDRASLYHIEVPEELLSLNYTGVLSSRLFVEGQYSHRKQTNVGRGSRFTDLVRGTIIFDRSRNNSVWNSPSNCAVCSVPQGELTREQQRNQNIIVKASYFLSTSRLGSHSLVSGFDVFDDGQRTNTWQSGSGFQILATSTIVRGEELFPVFTPDTTFIRWRPIFEESKGSRYRTYSAFLNDTWRLNGHFSFTLGLRWDKNDTKDQGGDTIARDDAWSPRLALTFDPRGNSDWTVNAGFARYVAAIANSTGEDGSAGGRPALFDYTYRGPAINADVNAPNPVPADQALTTLFNWFFASGGTDRPLRGSPSIPGLSLRVGDGLISPSNYEYTLGVTKRLGDRGFVRVDGVWREFRDFYTVRTDLTTGKVTDSAGRVYDLRILTNSNDVERSYRALIIQIAHRFGDRLRLNGNYTLSKTRGIFDGDDRNPTAGGAIPNDTLLFYPEYGEARWRGPRGNLKIDQRHKVRFWLNYDVPLPSPLGLLDVTVLERIDSGQPFSSDGVIDTRFYVTNPGYTTPPATVPYFFGGRGNFVTETATATDLSINYAHFIGLGKKMELFARFVVLNLFDESAQILPGDRTVLTNNNDPRYARFDPFTETPVRGIHWDLGPRFGQALSAADYQRPRTFSAAVGFRF
jgi:outer membrane receptor for ferrienterochelin and colicin